MYTPYITHGTQLLSKLISNQWQSSRNVQVSVIGAAGKVGSNLALLLKHNHNIRHMKLYDDDVTVKGIGCELNQLPEGPSVTGYSGHHELADAIRESDIIAMVGRHARKPGYTRSEMMASNSHPVLMLCKTMVEENSNAFLAISTNPVNSMVPFATALFQQFKCYNPYKLLGITNIDSARSRAVAAQVLKINPENFHIPVIGGHSDQTIVPLFSNIKPYYDVEMRQADTLTRIVRKAGTEVVLRKKVTDSATLAMAWSVNEFLEDLLQADKGNEVYLNCFTANPFFGTIFFSGPTKVGPEGVMETFYNYPMTEFESYLLNSAVPKLNKEIEEGEAHVDYVLGVSRV